MDFLNSFSGLDSVLISVKNIPVTTSSIFGKVLPLSSVAGKFISLDINVCKTNLLLVT